jgi:MFS transporter, FSR family, fosmidomycin resistance protein
LGGWIGDRFNRPRVITLGLTGVGLTSIAISFSSGYYVILALLIMLGLFAGAYHPSAVAFLSGLQSQQGRGKLLAVHMVGGSAGFALGPILGALAAVALGWRFAFLALSVPTLLGALLIFIRYWRQSAVPDMAPSGGAASLPGPEIRISLWQAIRPMLKVMVIVVLVQLIAGSASAFLPVYLVDVHGITPATATMMLGVMRGGGIFGSLLSGWLSDRWNRKYVILLAMVLTGLALLGLTNLPYGPASVVLMALFGVAMYMRGAAVQVYLMDSVPPYLRATVFGIYFGLGMEGMSLAQPIAGYFMDGYGIDGVFRSIAMISMLLAVIAPLLILYRRKKKIP